MRASFAAVLLVLVSTSALAVDADSLRVGKAPAGVALRWTDATPTVACVSREVAGLSFVDAPPAGGLLFYDVAEPPTGTCGGVVPACAPVASLACGGTDARHSAGRGSSSVLAAHAGCSAAGLTGPEMVYSFVAPSADDFDVRLLSGGASLDVAILRDAGAGCSTADCVAFGDVAASFTAQAGTTYFVVVDGVDPAGASYEISLACPAQQCRPEQSLLCGQAVAHSNAWPVFTDVIDSYPCSPLDASGPESAYRFTATQSGDATVTLSGLTAELDVFVLEESAGCEPSACVAHGDAGATFPIVAGRTYDVVVDGRGGAEGFFRIDLSCAVPSSACDPHGVIGCGDLVGNDTIAGRSAIASWPCSSVDASGPEYVFLHAPTENATVRVVMDLNAEDLDLHVVRNSGAGCDPSGCIAWGDQEVTFDAVAGETYSIVVDGRAGVNDAFRLWMDCRRVPGACRPWRPIACGETVSGTNDGPGSTDAIDAYDCRPYPEEGPELAYAFLPAATGTATATLTGLTADLDLFVLRDDGEGCVQASCVGAGNSTVEFPVVAGQTHYIVVEGYAGATGPFELTLDCR
jgi:hypothetical protein